MAMMNQRGQMVGPPGGVGAGAAGGLQPGMMPAGAGATMGPRPGMQYMAGPSPGGAGGMMPQGSPMGMQQQQQGGPSPAGGQFIHSPQSVPSPASVPMRPMPSSMQAPSPAGSMPNSAANTPMNPDQQPGSVEDQQYAEKVRELSRFIEPLRQKIAAMGREDDEKLAKMRRLLEILCNPSNKRLPMETLKKCEAVLNRMQQTQDLGG